MLRHQALHLRRPVRRDWLYVPRRAGRAARWASKAPAERLTLPAAGLVWAGAEILHELSVPWPYVGLTGAVALPALAYGIVLHRSGKAHGKSHDEAAWRASKAAIGMAVAGAWSAWAARFGVLAGPWDASTLAYLGMAGAAYAVVRRDEVVRGKRGWRNEKLTWLRDAAAYGLHGSHLIKAEPTRLGKRLLVDTRGTGKRASMIAGRHTAELIAEHKQLPPARIVVRPDRIAGRVWIHIRTRDPWAHPIPHPVLDTDPEITLAQQQSVRDPLIVGQDPETGKPLQLTLYDSDQGAKGLLIVALTGGGKTVLLNCIMERLTSCDDVLVWDINLSKGKENRRWADLCDLKAHGPKARKEALAILRLALKVIEYRGQSDSDDAVFQPTPTDPLIVIRVDEADALQGGNDYLSAAIKDTINKINSKKRSEGVVLVEAAQRGTISHTGSGDIRANFTNFAFAKTRSRAEMLTAAGDLGIDLPDMTSYGEGHEGVWLFTELGGDYDTGRTFKLKELTDITHIASGRKITATIPAALREYLGDAYERLKTGQATAHTATVAAAQPWMDDLEEELARDMDADLIEQIEALGDKNRQNRADRDRLDGEELPEITPGNLAAVNAARAERWRQAVATIDIPPHLAVVIITSCGQPGGAASRELAATLSVSKTTVWGYMAKLRVEGLVESRGSGRAARWHLTRDGAQRILEAGQSDAG